MPVLFRNESEVADGVPLPVPWDDADVVATVVLVDHSLAGDAKWVDYLQELSDQAETKGLSKRVFPVAMETGVLRNGLQLQAFPLVHVGRRQCGTPAAPPPGSHL